MGAARDGLPGDVRNQLGTILNEVTQARNSESTKVNLENRQKIIDSGSKVRQLTPEQRQAWVDAMKPVWKKFEDDIGADLMQAAQNANK